ncbi:glycine N-acyltransferase isoform X1 [Ornithorhynchus anatinus]|uniref:glycine N-acyltransferase isoform X1 n=2 Tax=Ornithorhynchus anatinus TaxID=9258 RepID=UPI0019D4D9AF|nr:glycine N-acyltransferase isoform X1 [Ornithorhynchus anatinus]
MFILPSLSLPSSGLPPSPVSRWFPVERLERSSHPALRMLLVRTPLMLQALERSLEKGIPESLKVYGTVYHVNRGNPFKLEALVDRWPDFNTVIVRPPEQEMTDDLDHYTNTYLIYSKDLETCREALASPGTINWKQHLQIQGLQPELEKVIREVAASKSVQVQTTDAILYISPETLQSLAPSLLQRDHANKLPLKTSRPKKEIDDEKFKLSAVEVDNAGLVNGLWVFGGNERSLRFIRRCIRHFPSFCLRGPEGTPVSWSLMDQTGEMRMGGTLAEYRNKGFVAHIIYHQIQALVPRGFPVYSNVARANPYMHRLCQSLGISSIPCGWHQWNCVPLASSR